MCQVKVGQATAHGLQRIAQRVDTHGALASIHLDLQKNEGIKTPV